MTYSSLCGRGEQKHRGTLYSRLIAFLNSRETNEKATETFLAAGSRITYNYPFVGPLVPWNAQWATALANEEYFLFLHIEAQFVDAWGDNHVIPFKMAYRASDDRWGDYKDQSETEPIVEVK